jgi:hypothetical protein
VIEAKKIGLAPPEAETIEERVAKATGALIAGRTLGAVLGEAK